MSYAVGLGGPHNNWPPQTGEIRARKTQKRFPLRDGTYLLMLFLYFEALGVVPKLGKGWASVFLPISNSPIVFVDEQMGGV